MMDEFTQMPQIPSLCFFKESKTYLCKDMYKGDARV